MANPYLQVLKAKRMKMSVGHSNPAAHVMKGQGTSQMPKVINFSDHARIKSPLMAGENMTKPTGTSKANRVRAGYKKQGKKANRGGGQFSRAKDKWSKPSSKYDMSKQ